MKRNTKLLAKTETQEQKTATLNKSLELLTKKKSIKIKPKVNKQINVVEKSKN